MPTFVNKARPSSELNAQIVNAVEVKQSEIIKKKRKQRMRCIQQRVSNQANTKNGELDLEHSSISQVKLVVPRVI